jgi:hypothetical protein
MVWKGDCKEAGLRTTVRMPLAAVLAACVLLAYATVPSPCRAQDEDGRVGVAELSAEAEEAIERGLDYLIKRQHTSGSWGRKYRVACTSLSLMAFMLKGYFPEDGQYGERLDKAVVFLIDQAKAAGGYMGVNMYEHGLATLALSEVWGMSERDEVRDVLKKAVDVILRSQSSRGGWRYQPRPLDADISVTVMQIVALSSAKEAGIHVPSRVIDRATRYVKSLQVRSVVGFGYTSANNPEFARSAAGVMSLLMCGERGTKEVARGLEYLQKYPKNKMSNVRFYYYGHYYAIQAMYQAGESYYQQWYPWIQADLLAHQEDDGHWSGRGEEGDPAYATAMAILVLGVPYRYLPIYQR